MRSAYEKRPKPMSGKNDISSLFKIIKENPDEYQEIVENEDAIRSRERWPLLSALPTTKLGDSTTEPLLKRSSSDINRTRKTSPANQAKQSPLQETKQESTRAKPLQEFFTPSSLEEIPSLKRVVKTLQQDEILSDAPIFINRATKINEDSVSIKDKTSKSKPLQEFFDSPTEGKESSLKRIAKTLEQDEDREESPSERPSLKKFVLTKIPTIKRKKTSLRTVETVIESSLKEDHENPVRERSIPTKEHAAPISLNLIKNENQLATIFERLKEKEVESDIEDKRSLFERLRRP